MAACRKRCWKTDWVIDLDIQKFFDSVPWDLVVNAVEANSDDRWVVLYVQRWLQAPVQLPNGALQKRDRGTPQGTVALARRAQAPPSIAPDQTACASSANAVASRCRGATLVASS